MKSMTLRIPRELAANCRKSPERRAWLELLPTTLREVQRKWSLTLDAPLESDEASCSYVAPVLRADGTPAVLKLAMPHTEGQDEIKGLRFWDGNPTVRLYEANDDLGAMLLERCTPGSALRRLPEPEQDVVISDLLRRLWREPPASNGFRPLSALTDYWSAKTLERVEEWPDAGLVREGLWLFEELPRNAPREVLLATDLHAGNVLCAEREPWLVIDPKPFVGDPTYDATQHLFNCQSRLRADVDGTIRSFADRLGVDPQRVRLWMFARAAAEPRDDWSNPAWVELARATAPLG
jgi:streptomycin 6-kinase